VAGLTVGGQAQAATAGDPWLRAQAIIERFKQPLVFPQREFVITDHGPRTCQVVTVDGYVAHHEAGKLTTPAPDAPDCYHAIAAAIAACSAAGGGRVLIPAGNWLVKGPIVLKSNVNVHLARGAH